MGLAQNLYRDAALGLGFAGGSASRIWGSMSPMARRTAIGAGVGAAYGAMSSNHSVVGMGLLGAGMGRYGYQGARALTMMSLHPQSSFGIGFRSIKAASRLMGQHMAMDGLRAKSFIGRMGVSANSGLNKFRGLFR